MRALSVIIILIMVVTDVSFTYSRLISTAAGALLHFVALLIFRKWPEQVIKYKAPLVMLSSLNILLNDPAELRPQMA